MMAKLDLASRLKANVEAKEPTLTLVPDVPDEPSEPQAAETSAAAAAPQVQPAAEPPAPAKASKPRRAPKSSAAPSAPRSEPLTSDEVSDKPIPLELGVTLDARLHAYRTQTRKSHHTILLDALESTYNELPGLVRAALGLDEGEPEKVSVFGRAPRTTAPLPTEDDGRRVRHTVRVTESNRELIDKMVKDFGAPSRNFLVVTAYEAFLPQLP